MPAASAAYLNQALEPTPNSLRSCVASAIGRGSPPAFDGDEQDGLERRDGLGKRSLGQLACSGQQDRPSWSKTQRSMGRACRSIPQ